MKKIIQVFAALTVLLFSLDAIAKGDGLYVGFGVGQSDIHQSAKEVLNTLFPPSGPMVKPDNKGVGGRGYFGYNFNQHFATEMGYSYFSYASYQVDLPVGYDDPEVDESAVDISAKFTSPAYNNIKAFATAGIAYVMTTSVGNLSNTTIDPRDDDSHKNFIRPTYGIGLSYNFTPRVIADISWRHISGSRELENIDFMGIGVSYHFVDEYCGEFLC